MTRRDFIEAAGSAAVLTAVGPAFAGDAIPADAAGCAAFQREIDEITPQDFRDYLADEAVAVAPKGPSFCYNSQSSKLKKEDFG